MGRDRSILTNIVRTGKCRDKTNGGREKYRARNNRIHSRCIREGVEE